MDIFGAIRFKFLPRIIEFVTGGNSPNENGSLTPFWMVTEAWKMATDDRKRLLVIEGILNQYDPGRSVIRRTYDPKAGELFMIRENASGFFIQKYKPPMFANSKESREYDDNMRKVFSVSHPYIVQTTQVHAEGGFVYRVSSISGRMTLLGLLESSERPVGTKRALRIIGRIAEALDHAHSNSVLHGNLNPSVVLLNDNEEPLISGFSYVLRNGEVEVGELRLVAQDDVFSLGVIAFVMMTKSKPFPDPKIAKSDIPRLASKLNPSLPLAVDAVFSKVFSRDAGDRQSTAGDFFSELKRALEKRN